MCKVEGWLISRLCKLQLIVNGFRDLDEIHLSGCGPCVSYILKGVKMEARVKAGGFY